MKDLDLFFNNGYVNGGRRQRDKMQGVHKNPRAVAESGRQKAHLNDLCVSIRDRGIGRNSSFQFFNCFLHPPRQNLLQHNSVSTPLTSLW